MKKPPPGKIYITAWLVYLTFSLAMFPSLKITVLLFSIPLSMLGGWFYSYKGALLTTLITVPAHYLLLNLYSDDPEMILEALNPFGIGTQCVFSCSTALLKQSQDRYRRLNSSLEQLVETRTKDLVELTDYLIDAQRFEVKELNTGLLEKPYRELVAMQSTCTLLKQKLQSENHPRAKDAESIHAIITSCIQQLKAMGNAAIPAISIQDRVPGCIRDLVHQIEHFSGATLTCPPDTAWDRIKPEVSGPLCELIYEAVGNAMRHANPEHIAIGIDETPERTVIYIENDGNPFAPDRQEGMGLPLMRYRARKIGGTFNIGSISDKITRVECIIPT